MSLLIRVLDDNLSEQKAFETLAEQKINPKFLAEVIRSEMSNLRTGNAHTKTRAEVSGTGKKPWKQKGTGRARHGSRRSPIWVGGGIAFGPRNTVNWHKKINKTARLSATRQLFKDKLDHKVIFAFSNSFDFPKTSLVMPVLENIAKVSESKMKQTLIIYTSAEKQKLSGFPNTEAKMINAENLRLHTLAVAKSFVLTPKALEYLEAKFK